MPSEAATAVVTTEPTPGQDARGASPTPVRWGFLAASSIASIFIRDLALAGGGVAAAVGARTLARAQEFAEANHVEKAYGSYEELVADPTLDVVYISSPHSHHHAHARLALEAGKAVVVEKPFAMTEAEAVDLVSLAAAKGVFLMEAMWTRCSPLTLDLAARVAAGELGEITSFSANLGPIGIASGHRALDASLGGGVLLEGLCYPVALLDQLAPQLGRPTVVEAVSSFTADGADRATSILLGFESGASAVMTSAFVEGVAGVASSRAHLSGTDGWAELPGTFFNPSRMVVASASATAGGSSPLTVDLPENRNYGYEIDEVHRCLRAGLLESPLVPLRSTLAVAETLDRVLAATRRS